MCWEAGSSQHLQVAVLVTSNAWLESNEAAHRDISGDFTATSLRALLKDWRARSMAQQDIRCPKGADRAHRVTNRLISLFTHATQAQHGWVLHMHRD